MAHNKAWNQKLAVFLMRRVREDDVIGAKSLLIGIDEQRKKKIVSKEINGDVPLCVAARHGKMVVG